MPSSPESRSRILVVEDDEQVNRILSRALSTDYDVTSAFDGVDALEKALAIAPQLIACDLLMPRMSGLELIKELRRRPAFADTSILVLTGNADDELRVGMLDGLIQDFVFKPCSVKELAIRVRSLLAIREAQLRLRQEAAVNEALYRVASSFSNELDQQKLLQLVTDEATALTGAQFGAFFFNEHWDTGGSYLSYTLSGAPSEEFANFPMPRVTQLFGPTFRGEGVIRLADVRQDPRYAQWGEQPAGHLPVVSYLAVPVLGQGGKVLGGLFFGHAEPGQFSEVHERIVRGLAVQAAAALEKARLYRALRESEMRAKAADRGKDEFLAMLGHELRNPLAPITAALQIMDLRRDSGSIKERQVIERQVRHLTHLVDDLLDVARVTRGDMPIHKQRIDVKSAIERAVEMASVLLEQRRHRLRLDLPDQSLLVDADLERLAQVVANLLTNAAKYTDPGGTIELRLRAEGARVSLSVKDDGQGIAPELLPRIFDLFVQGPMAADRAQGGLGIGLALVRNLVELHGGQIEARSAGPGCGSEFVIALPAAGAEAREQSVSPPSRPARGRARSRLLLVDDNIDAASMLSEILRLRGYEVVVAHDAAQALQRAESFRPGTALLDIGLPAMDGYELVPLLRARWREGAPVQLIAVTGYGQEKDKQAAKRAGFDAHLVKPVDVDALVALLEQQDARLAKQ